METIIDYINKEGGINIFADFYISLILAIFLLKVFSATSKTRKMIRPIIVFCIMCGISIKMDLDITKPFLEEAIKWVPLLLVVIFTPEIRQILMGNINKRNVRNSGTNYFEMKHEILQAIEFLAMNKIGALITFERKQSLEEYANKATATLDSKLSAELLTSLFVPSSPLHDGGVIISDRRIKCAGTYYPSTDRTDLLKNLGSRHRAAIGMSELNDSLTISVSEENGNVSVSFQGVLDYGIPKEELEQYLDKYVDNRTWW